MYKLNIPVVLQRHKIPTFFFFPGDWADLEGAIQLFFLLTSNLTCISIWQGICHCIMLEERRQPFRTSVSVNDQSETYTEMTDRQ